MVSTAPDRWRVLVIDDHAVTRSGIRLMAEAVGGVEIAGEGSTGADAVRLCESLDPDLVLIDLVMPEMSGLEAIRRIKESKPDTQVLVLTVAEDEDSILEAIRCGASGYLSKSSSASDIAEAISALRDGGTYMSPSVAGAAMRGLSRRREAPQDAAAEELLTAREREILVLLAQGLSARNIATRLTISERTVNTHIGHCYRKLGVNNRVDAVLAAMRLGLVEVPA